MSISEMKSRLDWEELRVFLAVAKASGLSGAARLIGVSAPTLGRRITTLERQLNQKLFDRKSSGYVLTEAGRELYEHVREMEAAATGVERWRDGHATRRMVRISAGAWTSRFLALNIDRLIRPGEAIAIDFLTTSVRLDIVRRQADIGLRNRAPEETRLSGRRINDVAYAIYRSRDADEDGKTPWIGVIGDGGITPGSRWVAARHAEDIVINCTDPRTVVDILHAGTGQAVLPCFVGDSFPGLRRAGGLIEELAEEQWMVLNDTERHQPAVRQVIDRVAALLKEHRALFRGDRPQG
jgi:DNA-binding transcriptional LysR family regulator